MKSKWARFLTWMSVPLFLILIGLLASQYLDSRNALDDSQPVPEQDNKISRTYRHFQTNNNPLSVTRPGATVRLLMPPQEVISFRERWKKKSEVRISLEDGPDRLAIVQVRGRSSRKSSRKSFDVQLEYPQNFGNIGLGKFFLLNLLADPHHFEMVFSYKLLSELDLFPCYFQWIHLFMNDEDEGLYLLVERPKDAIRRVWPDVVLIARPTLGKVNVVYARPRPDPLQLVRRLDELDAKFDEVEVAKDYENIVDLEGYLTWLAFNSLVENGDSRNEFYYYELPPDAGFQQQLRIVAWDYDDLQAPPIRPDSAIEDPLLYACEMPLDWLVKSDPSLYSRYKRVLWRLLTTVLTPEKLKFALNEVRSELDEIGMRSSGREQAEQQMIRHQEMSRFEERLLQRRQLLLDGLDHE